MNKQSIRKESRQFRKNLPASTKHQKDLKLCQFAERLISKLGSQKIFIYLATAEEPNLETLRQTISTGITFYAPVVINQNEMIFCPYDSTSILKPNNFGILEPANQKEVPPDDNTLIIIPCVAADKRGFRIGYGGGYYDRYLEQYPNIKTAGLCYNECLYENIPIEDHDKKLDFIITDLDESGVSL